MPVEDGVNGVVWVNGEYTNFGSAKVALEDRGFYFGDGIYEVARVYNGRTFALDRHLARLRRSAAAIDLELPLSEKEFVDLCNDLLKRGQIQNAEIYMQITRGVARRNHAFPENVKPSVIVGVRAVREVADEIYETGGR